MTSPLLRILPILLASQLASFAQSPTPESLKTGDLVAICGDSITEQKLYSMYIENYLLMCQPEADLQAFQAGWSGERAVGFLDRMSQDVLPFKPTVATTCYGMNDGGYAPLTDSVAKQYRDSLTSIVKTFRNGGVRFIVLGTPGAVDTNTYKKNDPAMYNKTLSELSEIARDVAAKEGVGFADVHGPMIDAMAKAKAKYGPAYHVGGGDGVHPQMNGQLIMAYAFLKGLGCKGEIGTLTWDAGKGSAEATAGHKVLAASNSALEVESSRYPFCFYGNPEKPEATSGIIEFIPFNEDLNRFMLVVKNTPSEKMKVTWGETTREFASADLAKGINLAAEFLKNPFSAPFAKVESVIAEQQKFETTATKTLLHGIISWKRHFPEEESTLTRQEAMVVKRDEELRAKSRAAVVPVRHTIKIEPVS